MIRHPFPAPFCCEARDRCSQDLGAWNLGSPHLVNCLDLMTKHVSLIVELDPPAQFSTVALHKNTQMPEAFLLCSHVIVCMRYEEKKVHDTKKWSSENSFGDMASWLGKGSTWEDRKGKSFRAWVVWGHWFCKEEYLTRIQFSNNFHQAIYSWEN